MENFGKRDTPKIVECLVLSGGTYIDKWKICGSYTRRVWQESRLWKKEMRDRRSFNEELEEEAGRNKEIYETLWSLARQRRRKYLKTRYDQASWTLESMGYNPDEEEEMEECGMNKRQRTIYLS
eukprot:g73701.t1